MAPWRSTARASLSLSLSLRGPPSALFLSRAGRALILAFHPTAHTPLTRDEPPLAPEPAQRRRPPRRTARRAPQPPAERRQHQHQHAHRAAPALARAAAHPHGGAPALAHAEHHGPRRAGAPPRARAPAAAGAARLGLGLRLARARGLLFFPGPHARASGRHAAHERRRRSGRPARQVPQPPGRL
jgi:hypothetical protein